MTELTASSFEARMREHATPEQVESFQRYFKTGPGEYGEGDAQVRRR